MERSLGLNRKIEKVTDVLAANDHHVSASAGVPGAATHAGAQSASDIVFTTADGRKKATGGVVIAATHAGKVARGVAAAAANAGVTPLARFSAPPLTLAKLPLAMLPNRRSPWLLVH